MDKNLDLEKLWEVLPVIDGITHIEVETFFEQHLINKPELILVDVRRPDEYVSELKAIDGAQLKTLGPELVEYLQKTKEAKTNQDKYYLFICRSGVRSLQAAQMAKEIGFSRVANLKGGMIKYGQTAQLF